MTNLLLCGVLVLLVPVSALSVERLVRALRRDTAHTPETGARAEALDEETRRSRQMTEGFDNLMSYSVKLGHGHSTGGEP